MARHPTALSSARFAIESSIGASREAADPSKTWLTPWVTAIDLTPSRATLQPRYLTADRFLRKPIPGEHTVAGTVSCLVGPENFTKFWYGMLSEYPISGCSNIYTSSTQHTFKIGSTQIFLENQTDKGYFEEFNRGGFIRTATFSTDRNSMLTANMDMQFQQVVTTDVMTTPSISTLDCFTDMKGSVTREAADTATDLDGFTLNWAFNPIDFKRFGSQYITDVVPGKSEVSWTMAAAFSSAAEFRRFLGDAAGTDQQAISAAYDPLKLTWEFQTGETCGDIAGTDVYKLRFTAYASYYETFPHGIASDSELLRSNPVLVVRYDSTGGCELQVDLVNNIGWAAIVY